MIIIRKINSAFYYLNLFFKDIPNKITIHRKNQLVSNWFKLLKKQNPQVLIGANILKPNGVDFHIHAIHKNSALETQLVPPDHILERLSMGDFLQNYLTNLPLKSNSTIHSHVYPGFIEWCFQKKAENKSIKWIHTYHLHYFNDHSSKVLSDWQKEFNRVFVEVASKADIKISVSKWQQAFYKENFNIDTVYIPNGVNVEQCDQADPVGFKKTYGIDNFILNVSRHDPVKNPKEFVKLAIAMPTYEFVIIGSELTEGLFIEHYAITPPDNLKIFGKMTQVEVQNAIAACACLVSTSKREGLPTLVLEAMTQAKPVVVSNELGSMEAIDSGRYGYYYTLGDIEGLKKKTMLAINDNDIGLKARQRILEEYDWRVVIKKLDSIYNA
jgi:glycosyltransferase involved in cell wall biosynthesis